MWNDPHRYTWTTLIIASVLFFWSSTLAAQVPDTMTYVGDLSDGNQSVDKVVPMTFELYDARTGGTAVWSESYSSVQVTNGKFSVELGSKTSIEDVFDGNRYWLQVTVDGQTMQPRMPAGISPYALRAQRASEADNAAKVDGKTPQQIVDSVQTTAESTDYQGSNVQANNVREAVDTLSDRIDSLESQLQDKADQSALQDKADQSALQDKADQSALQDKADKSALQSKADKSQLSNYARKSELESKADESQLTSYVQKSTLNNYYTKSQSDNRYYTKSQSDNRYYTKSDADSKFATQSDLSSTQSDVNQLQQDYNSVDSRVKTLEDKTQDMTRTQVNGTNSVLFEGVNVHLRNGNGDTDSSNGAGNLIVGYDEGNSSNKTGSHNVVVGQEHTYTSYGGVVAGRSNEISGNASSVLGGRSNEASGQYAAVSGGRGNQANSNHASVCGGRSNEATGEYATVSGGQDNTASGNYSSVQAGENNEASGGHSSVSGGGSNFSFNGNTASGNHSTVSGGVDNETQANESTIGGGDFETLDQEDAWRVESLTEGD